MTGDYAYTPPIWPSLLTVLLLVALAAFSWRRRTVPGARVFAVTCLIAVPWVAGAAMEEAAVDAAGKLFWFKFQAAWQLPVITALTCFVLEYAWPGRWLTRRNLILLSIPPLLVAVMVLTDNVHHLAWRDLAFADGQVVKVQGPGALVSLAYGYVLSTLALVVLAWLFLRSPRHRWPVAIIFAGATAARVLFSLELAHVPPSGLFFNVPPIAVEYAAYAVALFGFRIFDPIPAARRAVIAQMREGVLVLDPEGRVAGLNPAAERILGLPETQAMGRPVRELLPTCPTGPLADPAGAELEISLPERRHDGGVGQEVRQYVLEISPLTDWRGLEVGRLLLLRDVTERRRAQAQILEQQRALAMLSERERLARELHDGIGQVLGYVKMQAQAARDRLAQDETAAADRDLAHLIAVAQDAHADVREYMLGTRSAAGASAPPGFSPALRQYLRRFSEQYGLRTDLAASPDWSDEVLEPTVQVQLLRIIQEALTNARKHAKAQAVQVSVQLPTDHAQVTVQDDGVGFDPALLTGAEGQEYGLGLMRERAQEVGGSVEIHSAPGAGTQVLICVPRRKEQA